MSGPLDGLWGAWRRDRENWWRHKHYSAEVVEKVGTRVKVLRLGALSTAEVEGPYPTAIGVIGAVRVGTRVIVDWSLGSPLVGLPPADATPANQMQRVAEDFTEAVTDSHTDWVTLLDTGETLLIPATSAFEVWWTSYCEQVGSASSNQMNIRIVLNNIVGTSLTVGLPGQASAERAFVSPYSIPAGFRMVGGQIGSFIYDADVGEVTRVRLQGRTNDTAQENDLLHAYGLVVFA